MKYKKLFKFTAIIISLLLVVFAATACDESEEKENEETEETGSGPVYADHTVQIVDTIGNPISDVIVKFVAEDGASKTKLTDENGVALYVNGLVGNFTIEIDQGDSDIVIDNKSYEFAEGKSSLVIVVRNDKNTMDIFGDTIPENGFAGVVSVGEYNIPEGKSGLDYYVFSARTSGVYKVSVISSNTKTTVGYYGNPMIVRDIDIYAGKNDGKGYELVVQEGGAPYVIGVNRADDKNFTLKIERIGDAPFDPAFAPWTQIESVEKLEMFELPFGTELVDLDITDNNLSINLREDGRYYTADGRMVYIHITSCSKYWDIELARLVGKMDSTTGINIGGYVYDDNGDFVDKYSYNNMICSYIDYCDGATGVYPLTEELVGAIKHHGDSTGWWNKNSSNYLFWEFDGVIEENAWMFMCCVVDAPAEPDVPDVTDEPTMEEVADRFFNLINLIANDIKKFFE